MKKLFGKYEIVAWFEYSDDAEEFLETNQDLTIIMAYGGYTCVKRK